MESIKRLKIGLPLKLSVLVILGAMIFLSSTPVMAYGDKIYAPPQLDEQQANLWLNTLPASRPYLARMWDIPQPVAEYYGAMYKMPVCGYYSTLPDFGDNQIPLPTTIIGIPIPPLDPWGDPDPITGKPRVPDSIWNKPIGDEYSNEPWGIAQVYIEQFEPIKIDYSKPQEDKLVALSYYEYPPMLDRYQGVRWGQALPTARMYLARLWDIPTEIAVMYGARY